MIKIIITIICLFLINPVYSQKKQNDIQKLSQTLSKEEKEDLKGRKKLPLKERVNAEKRYKKLITKLTIPEDKDDICNQLLYIENGYFDYGYMPKLSEYYEYKDVPEGFWVYVYPNWYIWEEQILF